MTKIKIKNILNKKNKIPIICLTSYSKSVTQIVDKYCDIILVGDSLGMVLYGMKSTRSVSIETMILHCKTVKKFAKKSLVVCDMPYKTYKNKFVAYKNACKIMSLTNCDAVKLEGAGKVIDVIKYLTKKGVPVVAHLGLLPQTSRNFKVRGKNNLQKKRIFNEAIKISKSGAFAVVLECVVPDLAKKITKNISIPTIGIGASQFCDGQILVSDDMLGLSDFNPKFVKKYSNLRKVIDNSVKNYVKDVKLRKFPFTKNIYK